MLSISPLKSTILTWICSNFDINCWLTKTNKCHPLTWYSCCRSYSCASRDMQLQAIVFEMCFCTFQTYTWKSALEALQMQCNIWIELNWCIIDVRCGLRHNNSHENIIQLMRRVCGTRIELNFDAMCDVRACVSTWLWLLLLSTSSSTSKSSLTFSFLFNFVRAARARLLQSLGTQGNTIKLNIINGLKSAES